MKLYKPRAYKQQFMVTRKPKINVLMVQMSNYAPKVIYAHLNLLGKIHLTMPFQELLYQV